MPFGILYCPSKRSVFLSLTPIYLTPSVINIKTSPKKLRFLSAGFAPSAKKDADLVHPLIARKSAG